MRHQSFKRLSDLVFAVGAELDFNRLAVCAKVKRGLEFIGQIGEGYIFVNLEMFHESVLQMTIVGKHALCAASPWCDCSFGQSFGWIGNHQLRIDDQLRPQTVTSRAGAEMAVE